MTITAVVMMFVVRASSCCCAGLRLKLNYGRRVNGDGFCCRCVSVLVALTRDSTEKRDGQGSLTTDFVLVVPPGLPLPRLLSARTLVAMATLWSAIHIHM